MKSKRNIQHSFVSYLLFSICHMTFSAIITRAFCYSFNLCFTQLASNQKVSEHLSENMANLDDWLLHRLEKRICKYQDFNVKCYQITMVKNNIIL